MSNRIRRRRFDERALMLSRQEARGEIALIVVRQSLCVGHHDERRQVIGNPTECVRHPRPHARKARQSEAGILHVAGESVNVTLRDHRR